MIRSSKENFQKCQLTEDEVLFVKKGCLYVSHTHTGGSSQQFEGKTREASRRGRPKAFSSLEIAVTLENMQALNLVS